MKKVATLAPTATLGILLMVFAPSSDAQSSGANARDTRFETRAQLELAARNAANEHRGSEVALLEARLRAGDFQEGDRVIVAIEIPRLSTSDNLGSLPLGGVDTAVVRAGKMLQFVKIPKIPDLCLSGVLRSELVDSISAHVGKYVRNPTVRATPLLRVAVLGAVVRPGWYFTPGDATVADLLMQAGGVGVESNVDNTLIRRGGQDIWSSEDVRAALADGISLDQLHLRAGDEVYVNPKRQWSLTNSIQIFTAVAGAYVALRLVRQPHK